VEFPEILFLLVTTACRIRGPGATTERPLRRALTVAVDERFGQPWTR
jgi:hypothetical protein